MSPPSHLFGAVRTTIPRSRLPVETNRTHPQKWVSSIKVHGAVLTGNGRVYCAKQSKAMGTKVNSRNRASLTNASTRVHCTISRLIICGAVGRLLKYTSDFSLKMGAGLVKKLLDGVNPAQDQLSGFRVSHFRAILKVLLK